jgi:phosphate-selective porin OprO/OprP
LTVYFLYDNLCSDTSHIYNCIKRVLNMCKKQIGDFVLLLVLFSNVLHATENKNINELLRDKGIITEQEYNELETPLVTSTLKPTVKVGGRIMIDAAFYDSSDIDINNGTEIRRARIFIKGDIGDSWFYKAQYDLVYSGIEGVRSLYLGYRVNDNTKLRVGNLVTYGSLEDTTSSKYITFMERSMPMLAFVPAARRMGIGMDSHGKHWYAGGGVFGKRIDVDEDGDESIGASTRLVVAPINDDRRLLHIGASGSWRTPENGVLEFKARPESHISDFKVINTPVISNVNSRILYGMEIAAVYGRFSAQSEYTGVSIRRDSNYATENIDGFYIQGSWFLTGESKPYYTEYGTFGRIKPNKCVGDGGIGAWELAARYSNLDANGKVYTGKGENITVGLNWYTTPYIRFMLNYINSSVTGADGNIDINIIQMRAQVDF